MPFLLYALTLFWIWMLIDALRRRADLFWILLMAFVPISSVVYFFAVKARDYERWNLAALKGALLSGSHLAALRERAREVPSIANLLELGEALHERRRYEEARDTFERAFQADPNNLRSAYGLARTCSALQDFERAATLMAPVVAIQPSYRDYDAWLCLAHALWHCDRREEALESLRNLARTTRMLRFQVTLADYLISAGLVPAARAVLEEALREHDLASAEIQGRERRWQRLGHKMLRRLGKAPKGA